MLTSSITPCSVAGGFPDSRTCLLHQKLQMLNVCMERRRIREGGLPFAMTKRDESAEEDDEFYDCSTEDDDDKHSSGGGEGAAAPWNRPEGRLSRLGEHTTLVGSDEPLYVPVTQEPVPKTEDQLERDAEVMLQLGPDNGERVNNRLGHIEYEYDLITGSKWLCSTSPSNDERFSAIRHGQLQGGQSEWPDRGFHTLVQPARLDCGR